MRRRDAGDREAPCAPDHESGENATATAKGQATHRCGARGAGGVETETHGPTLLRSRARRRSAEWRAGSRATWGSGAAAQWERAATSAAAAAAARTAAAAAATLPGSSLGPGAPATREGEGIVWVGGAPAVLLGSLADLGRAGGAALLHLRGQGACVHMGVHGTSSALSGEHCSEGEATERSGAAHVQTHGAARTELLLGAGRALATHGAPHVLRSIPRGSEVLESQRGGSTGRVRKVAAITV